MGGGGGDPNSPLAGVRPRGGTFYVRGIITYTMSQYELRLFNGFFSKGIPRWSLRFTRFAAYLVPPLALSYGIFRYGESEYERSLRKGFEGEH